MNKKYLVVFGVIGKYTDTISYNDACKSFQCFTETGLIYYVNHFYDLKNSIKETLKQYLEIAPDINSSITEIDLSSFLVHIYELKGLNITVPNLISLNEQYPNSKEFVFDGLLSDIF